VAELTSLAALPSWSGSAVPSVSASGTAGVLESGTTTGTLETAKMLGSRALNLHSKRIRTNQSTLRGVRIKDQCRAL
jgi:hypothetical protein